MIESIFAEQQLVKRPNWQCSKKREMSKTENTRGRWQQRISVQAVQHRSDRDSPNGKMKKHVFISNGHPKASETINPDTVINSWGIGGN